MFLVDALGLNKVQGKPFSVAEVVEKDSTNSELGPERTLTVTQRGELQCVDQPS